jgi:hypothetical protein
MRFDHTYKDPSYIHSCDERKTISLVEKRKKYTGHNNANQTITVYRVDGGVIADHRQAKCDYAIHTGQTNHLYLIELKGSDYPHALEQIISTLDILLKQAGVSAEGVYARIILSKVRVPNIRVAQETRIRKMLKQLNGNAWDENCLKKETNIMTENIN